ncbi:MAG: hypothetical protein KDE51_12240 [Anaerolineales bacterium]|nr:hypothetical protein [Anaerolineales bacterium]
MFKQQNSHWEASVLAAVKLPEGLELWQAELPQVWQAVRNSYSGSAIAESQTVRKPFEHRWGGHRVGQYPYGGYYVATSGVWGPYVNYYHCYLLTAREAYEGQVGEYREWEWHRKRGDAKGSYAGMLVRWRKRPYVLTGPPQIWWQKGKRFAELLALLHAPAVQKIQQVEPMPTMSPAVQLKLF